ncbi:MAG: Gx transporter family protein [Lachnobacterium sp.]|nr:Gx transporter family protein [Lachnobacterium sp.]
MKKITTKKTAQLGVYIALAMILSYVESLIPFSFGVPGIKLGLTNVVTVIMMYTYGIPGALGVAVLRAVLSGFMFGNAFSIIYSVAGCVLSFIFMYILKKTNHFAIISVSAAGGVMHNVGQLIVAANVVKTYSVIYYAPVLIIAGVFTGIIIGIVSDEIVKRIGNRMET